LEVQQTKAAESKDLTAFSFEGIKPGKFLRPLCATWRSTVRIAAAFGCLVHEDSRQAMPE
jgi:hypothetical protein